MNRNNSIFWRYRCFVRKKMAPDDTSMITSLKRWQSTFLTEVMIYIIPISIIACILSVIISIQEGLYIVALYDTLALFLLFFVLFLPTNKTLSKKIILLLIFYFLGVILLYYLGWVGPGLIYLLGFSALSTLLINKTTGIITLLGNAFILAALIAGASFDRFASIQILTIEPFPAAIIGLNYILINLALVTGISSLTKALEKNIKSEREISSRLGQEVKLHEKARLKAEESDRLKSAFLANMSHEIRTPMNGVLGFTQLLKQVNLKKDERQEFIEIIEQSGERLLNIINNLIDISKIEANQVTVKKHTFHIHKCIKDICNFFTPEMGSKGLELICDDEDCQESFEICSDKNKIEAILTNLIKNAIKFTDKGFITVKCSNKKEQLIISVEDSGIGISANQQHYLFARFMQIENPKPTEGSGLGLAITKAYVEMLNGTITLESEENKGSKFTVVLPLD